MGVQKDLLEISKAKRNSTRVASDGYYFAYCFNENDWYEVQEGYVLDQFCNEEKLPSIDQFERELSPYNGTEDLIDGNYDGDYNGEHDGEYYDTGSY